MTWVKLDDAFPDHPKVDGLSDGAFRLHVAALCYSGRHLTDGALAADRVSRLVPRFRRSYVTELVEAGLWEAVDGGWSIHDFLAYNPSAEKVKADRAAAAERMKQARRRSPARSAERSGKGSATPSPTRPDRDRVGGDSLPRASSTTDDDGLADAVEAPADPAHVQRIIEETRALRRRQVCPT